MSPSLSPGAVQLLIFETFLGCPVRCSSVVQQSPNLNPERPENGDCPPAVLIRPGGYHFHTDTLLSNQLFEKFVDCFIFGCFLSALTMLLEALARDTVMLSVLALVKHPSLNYISCKMQLLISLQEHTCGIIFLQFSLRCFDLKNNTDVLKYQRFFICLFILSQ